MQQILMFVNIWLIHLEFFILEILIYYIVCSYLQFMEDRYSLTNVLAVDWVKSLVLAKTRYLNNDI